MRQLPSDKYNVAWFKLAEFVSRGERERALCLYKLLIHSFDDYALAAQLEGDILLSFNDIPAACLRYRGAALLYIQNKKLIEAAAVYEHILLLDETSQDDLMQTILLYEQLGINSRLCVHLNKLCSLFVYTNQIDRLEEFMEDWEKKITNTDVASLYNAITVALIKNKNDADVVRAFLKKSINLLLLCKNASILQTFLSTIEALHEDYYFDATMHMQEL